MILFLGTLAYVIGLLTYEGWAIVTHHPTITEQVQGASKAWGFLGAFAGFVAGGLLVHFFWT